MKKKKLYTQDDMNKEFKKNKKKRKSYPVYYFFRDLYYSIIRFFDLIPLNIKTFIQRGKRGWGNSDTWGLDYYLADIIEHTVKHLKKHTNSVPNGLTEGQWVDILNDISYTFYLAKRCAGDCDNELFLIRDKKTAQKWNKSLEDINKEFDTNSKCMTSEEIKAYDKGWKLFKEHFFNLWD